MKNKKIDKILKKLASHKISVGKATEKCKCSLVDFLEVLKKKKINWTNYNSTDLKKDLRRITKSTTEDELFKAVRANSKLKQKEALELGQRVNEGLYKEYKKRNKFRKNQKRLNLRSLK